MKKCLSILAIGLLFLTSCLNELQGDREEATGPSNIAINISAKPQTKLGTASDGDVMSNLHIWLVYGTTVKGYLCQDDADCNISGTGSTATAIFENVPRGACTLYLVANLPKNSTLPTDYRVGGKAIDDAFLKYVLPTVENYEPPYGASTQGMPLSTSVSLSVGAGTNKVSAALVRTCAKLTITVRNNTTNNTIILKDLILSDKNPQVGYLFEQPDYSIPSAAQPFTSFDSISYSADSYVTDVIPQGGERIYVQQYMYETATDGAADLGFRIVGGLFPNGTDSAQLKEISIRIPEYNQLVGTNPVTTITSDLNENEYYLINNGDYFLYYDISNNQLKAKAIALNDLLQYSDDELKPYKWKINSTGTTISEMVSGYNYSINITEAGVLSVKSGGAVLSTGYSTDYDFRFYNGRTEKVYNKIYNIYNYALQITQEGEVAIYDNSSYFIRINNGTPALSGYVSTAQSCRFKLYKGEFVPESTSAPELKLVGPGDTPADVYFDKNISSLNYINKYGIPVPLEQIRRNQDVKIVVNIHYNPNSGVLFFETSDWDDDENETTFD